ncbi:MAG: hypothetical protein E6J90_10545 [Deltaproteobacteria bacterium]|nr:MAG: hypothetical protein E6J91_30055 [Deltaproteobacteria bacterium]TMQ23483.1 MAG: hypothetical protein E6J90_10545 [Deltaproteobacteria bacterium]
MSLPRRIAGSALVVIALGVGALVVAGAALEDRSRRSVAGRIAESLQAEAAIERGDLALVRGALDLEGLTVRRDDAIGHLAITVPGLHCELPPLGLALVDRDCRELAIAGARLEVSAAALFKLRPPRRRPFHARRIVIDDARLAFSPSAFVPGLGQIAIDIAYAETGETTFKTPLSWLFALHELRATISLPAGIAVQLSYDHGELRAAGDILGAAPIVVPVALPVADPSDDAHAEIARLVVFARQVAERLVARKAADWLESKLPR